MRNLRAQGAFTLIELVVGLSLSVFLMGAVLLVQHTANSGFQTTIEENRTSKRLRETCEEIKRELRGSLDTSIVSTPWPGDDDGVLLSFQNAVGFDVVNGSTQWGAADVVGATYEFYVSGNDLCLRVREVTGAIQQGSDSTLVGDLAPMQLAGAVPVRLEWDADERTVSIEIRTACKIGGQDAVREVESVIFVERVFSF